VWQAKSRHVWQAKRSSVRAVLFGKRRAVPCGKRRAVMWQAMSRPVASEESSCVVTEEQSGN
jgi:hypothetical protein